MGDETSKWIDPKIKYEFSVRSNIAPLSKQIQNIRKKIINKILKFINKKR